MQVKSDEETVEVWVYLGPGLTGPPATPAALPDRLHRSYTKDELGRLNADAGSAYNYTEWVTAAVSAAEALVTGGILVAWGLVAQKILHDGIETDEYDLQPLRAVSVLDSKQTVWNASPDSILGGEGVTVDDNQPFPVYGWIEAKWVGAVSGPAALEPAISLLLENRGND